MCLLSSHFAHATPGVWRRRNGHHSARAHARGWRTSRLGVERPMDGSIISDFPSVPFRHISGCPRIGASGACCRSLAKNIGGKEDCSCREPHSRDDKDPDSWTFPGASASGLLFSLLLCLWCCWFLCTPGPPPTKIDRKQQAQPVVVASWLVPRWDQHGRPARLPCWDDEHQARSEQRTSVYETYIANSLNTDDPSSLPLSTDTRRTRVSLGAGSGPSQSNPIQATQSYVQCGLRGWHSSYIPNCIHASTYLYTIHWSLTSVGTWKAKGRKNSILFFPY